MTKKERYKKVIDYFSKTMPLVTTELNFKSPFQLLIAVILSAQCTDKRVNIITITLFDKYPDAKSMSKASEDDIFEIIKSCTYPNSKAKYLLQTATILIQKYKGEIPKTSKELEALPGVGRKTANVILTVLYREPKMPVDTHVFRVSKRLGLVSKTANIIQTEKELEKNFPDNIIPDAHHWLILFGRNVCSARNPKCDKCNLKLICIYDEQQNIK